MSKTIQFIINPSEIGAGTRGASLGPYAVLAAARTTKNPVFQENPMEILTDFNHHLDKPTQFPFAKHIDGMQQVYQEITKSLSNHLENNRFPFLISGDHGSAGGTLAGLKQAFPNQRIGVIWIDAHADLHSPYTTPSGNLHGMPLAAALGMDNLPCQRHHLDIDTSLQWNQLKSHAVKPSDLIYIGVRSTEPEEEAAIAAENILNVSVAELRQAGIHTVLNQIFTQLSECDLWYVSFDVDSMDPEETSYGTGTPVPNGLHVHEARQLLEGLCASPKLTALEFVEVNPLLDDKKNTMAEIALDLITHCSKTLVSSWNSN